MTRPAILDLSIRSMERNTSGFAGASWDSKMVASVAGGMKLLFWNVQFGLLMCCQSVQYMWIDQELLIIYIYTRGLGQVKFSFYDIWLRNNFVAQHACEHKERHPDSPTPRNAYMASLGTPDYSLLVWQKSWFKSDPSCCCFTFLPNAALCSAKNVKKQQEGQILIGLALTGQ